MFSPETYALLKSLIDKTNITVTELNTDVSTLDTDVSDLKTSTANRMAKTNNNFTSAMLTYLNTAFDNAENNSIVTGNASASTWAMSWWGVKSKSTWTNTFFFSTSASGGSAVGIATRAPDGTWSGVAFDLSR